MECFHFELFKYKGKIYHTYLIRGTQRRVFFNVQNGKKIYPNASLKRKLLKVHKKLFEVESKPKNKIRFTSLVVNSILSLALSGMVLNAANGDIVGRTLTMVPTSSSMEEFLQISLSKNDNLNDEERHFFEMYATYLNDNPYIEEKNIYYNLTRFETFYDFDTTVLETGIAGSYSIYDNLISVYDGKMYEALEDRETLGHEGFHLLSNNGDTCGFKKNGSLFGNGISEAMTEILKEEYILKRANGFTTSYKEESLITKFIIELIGIEPMLYGYAKGDTDIVIEALSNINHDTDKTREFIGLIDSLKYVDKFSDEYKVLKEKIYQILQSYYQACGEMSESKKAVLTYYMECFYHYRENSSYILCYDLYKPYFNSELKQDSIPHLFFTPASTWEEFSPYLPDDCNKITYILESEPILNTRQKMLIKEKLPIKE